MSVNNYVFRIKRPQKLREHEQDGKTVAFRALIFTSWAKAGLEYDWILWIVDLVVLVIAISTLLKRGERGRHFRCL